MIMTILVVIAVGAGTVNDDQEMVLTIIDGSIHNYVLTHGGVLGADVEKRPRFVTN